MLQSSHQIPKSNHIKSIQIPRCSSQHPIFLHEITIEIDGLPIHSMVIFHSYLSLPEAFHPFSGLQTPQV